jgi:hypothetical protein
MNATQTKDAVPPQSTHSLPFRLKKILLCARCIESCRTGSYRRDNSGLPVQIRDSACACPIT